MKTYDEALEQVQNLLEKSEQLENFGLTTEVYEQLGADSLECFMDTLADVCKGGANAGFAGFTYSNDMLNFWQDNQSEIVSIIEEDMEQLGESQDIIKFIQSWNCLKDSEYTSKEIYDVLYGDSEESSIIDACCWFLLERAAFLTDI